MFGDENPGTRRRLAGMCLAVLASAGPWVASVAAQSEGSGGLASERALAEDETRIRLNSKGGDYTNLWIPARPSQEFALMITRRNFDPDWFPTQTLCLESASSSKKHCVQFLWIEEDDGKLAVLQRDFENNKAVFSAVLRRGYPMKSQVRLKINISEGEVEFNADGSGIKRSLDFKPDRIKLTCSSADCIFTLL